MNISFVKPRSELLPYIDKLFVVESRVGLPSDDRSIVAPNGCAKLVIPCVNSILSVIDGHTQVSRAQQMYFVGAMDCPALIQTASLRTIFITIVFAPQGAFQIFGVPMSDTSNRLWDTDDVFGSWSRDTRKRIRSLPTVAEKVAFIQEQLLVLLRRNRCRNSLVETCIDALRSSDGRIAIKELQRTTGHSWRYLDRVFQERVGLSPKALARIFRFQRFYRKWANGESFGRFRDELYDYYYDQAHFTREFRRMTGHSPANFVRDVPNEFGRRLVGFSSDSTAR